jgi:hypothetical protein
VLMRRGIGRRLPWFCGYIAWNLVSDVAAWLAMAYSPTLYTRFYFYEIVVDCALQFTVLLELGWSVLRLMHAGLDKRNVWLVGSILFLAGMMLWPWAAASTWEHFTQQARALMQIQLTIGLLRIVCLVAIVAVSQFFAIGWRDRELYVAAGLGFYSLCSLVVTVIQFRMAAHSWLLDLASSAAYVGVLLYWIVQFASERDGRAPV